MGRPTVVFLAATLVVAAGRLEGGGIVDLGLSDEFTLSQPVVQVQVGSFGPLDLNEYLLDTGASGILAGANSSSELLAKGLVTEATYVDYGVAGPQSTGVSRPYDFFFAGTDGVPRTLPGARMQTSSGDFAFYSGIAGMPLMAGRTVGFNLASQADMNDLRIGVAFDVTLSSTLAPHQYSVPLTMVTFPASGQQNPADPLPENAALPFVPVRAQYGATTKTTNFLLDTGAQQCILSAAMAFDLGLDVNRNGSLEDEAISFQTVAGVGGSVEIPVLRIDTLAVRTAGDVDLMFRDITVGVVDIDPALPGVLGMNVLNSGWEIHALNTFLGQDPGPPGVFSRVDLDFRSTQGEMRLTLDGPRDSPMPQGPLTMAVASGSQTQAQAGYAVVGGSGSLVKAGGGTLVLDAVNTLTGTTLVQAGSLRIAAANALFGSPTVVGPGAAVSFAPGVVARVPSITLAGGTLVPGGSLAINGTTGVALLVVDGGRVDGTPAVAITAGGELRLAGTGGPAIAVSSLRVDDAAGGFLDLGRQGIVVSAGGITRPALLAGLAAGRAGGDWSGTVGIGSSAARSAIGQGVQRTVGWVEQGDGSLLIAYAAAGDTNLDGLVDILDVSDVLSAGQFGSGQPSTWATGDFTFDGVVDILDLGEFAGTALFNQASYLQGVDLQAAGGVAVVPEPAAAAFVAAGVVAVMSLTRRIAGRRLSRAVRP